ncbi:MAG: 4Fe-4S binding protein [Pseudomonadota bacterium]|nr:4Fe-4S binding protein [Pseudomonadota bacterium]
MLQELIDKAREEFKLPGIDSGRCVHALVESASCRACVDACPRGAWRLDDESLGIDTACCDGCGLCVPVCPEGALSHDYAPAPRHWKGRPLAYAACERTGPAGSTGVIPCLHAIGLQTLLRLHRDGHRTLIIAAGDCEDCPRGITTRLNQRVDSLNAMLDSRGMPRMALRLLPGDKWRAMFAGSNPGDTGHRTGRRSFLRRVAGRGVAQGMKTAGIGESGDETYRPPSTLLPRASANDVLVCVPTIRPDHCNGCDACARLCPHHAIEIQDEDDRGVAYRIHAERCTGCGICHDACDREAVFVERDIPQTQLRVKLGRGRCRSCGAPYHLPVAAAGADTLCRICARTNHNRNLYQVLD